MDALDFDGPELAEEDGLQDLEEDNGAIDAEVAEDLKMQDGRYCKW